MSDNEHERMPMQYLVLEAAQDPTFQHGDTYGGAQVGCWIKDQTEKNAYLIAKGWIEAQGWVVLSLDQQKRILLESYADGDEGKQYFEQALIDEEVFVFYTFSKDA
jgi:hypothetical protein